MIQFLLLIVLTVVASRNLPGFLELLIRGRIKMTSGELYALLTVLRSVGVELAEIGDGNARRTDGIRELQT